MRPYIISAKLMRSSNMERFPTPGLECKIMFSHNSLPLFLPLVSYTHKLILLFLLPFPTIPKAHTLNACAIRWCKITHIFNFRKRF
jgi:hypothetical protein